MMTKASSTRRRHPRWPPMWISLQARPKASAVMAHAMREEAALVARLSWRHARTWWTPASLDAAPTTPARMANTRK
ncbi:Os07g0422250 [Oryza sativa Japonica Group]|uniref:Os07g0422250 protein n=1 Tax=Oryza sativa subsp. japonica TaxID=39947 RepID=A0A0P0X616_ORYSJ|nr:hypothetical protein EE612_038784 [Oryza sativa]BAT01198.1 Os07g0422250 [Oryza sativa Japonica Group]